MSSGQSQTSPQAFRASYWSSVGSQSASSIASRQSLADLLVSLGGGGDLAAWLHLAETWDYLEG